jgi:hypothetical protein
MKRAFFLTALMMGVAAISTFAQQPLPVPPPPPASPQPRLKQPMSDEQRGLLEQRLDAQWSRMTLEGKQHVMRLHRALAEMPPDERRFIHDRIERFLNMTPAERARLQQNRQRWEQMTPEQRQLAREEFRKRRQEFEQQGRRNSAGEESPNNAPPPPVDNSGAPASPPPPPSAP